MCLSILLEEYPYPSYACAYVCARARLHAYQVEHAEGTVYCYNKQRVNYNPELLATLLVCTKYYV